MIKTIKIKYINNSKTLNKKRTNIKIILLLFLYTCFSRSSIILRAILESNKSILPRQLKTAA